MKCNAEAGYTLADFIPCEICGGQATEIHPSLTKRNG
jgi:rRNA maturation protein Nop10